MREFNLYQDFFMLNTIAIFIGGGLGAILRYIIFLLVQRPVGQSFPAGTLAANLIGALAIGFLWGFFESSRISHEWRLFLFTGLLGGFTTFSTFCRETAQLMRIGDWKSALIYVSVSNILGVALVVAGFFLARRMR